MRETIVIERADDKELARRVLDAADGRMTGSNLPAFWRLRDQYRSGAYGADRFGEILGQALVLFQAEGYQVFHGTDTICLYVPTRGI